jgi:hydroxymethylbilane synthase
MQLRIGTRGSALALWQANHVADRLRQANPGLEVSLTVIKTTGDKIQDLPLAQVGGKGLFVKEIEEALLDNRVDLAVHSLKDVPAELPAPLGLIAILPREDPSDALLVRPGLTASLSGLPHGAHVGTSSLRRQLQLRALRPDVRVSPLRGNVDTRLRKLDEGGYDAIILAAAGLIRLGFGDRISQKLNADEMLPAVGQGLLGLEARRDDEQTRARVSPLHDPRAACMAAAERAVNESLAGGCQVPIAAFARYVSPNSNELHLRALVGSPDGSEIIRAEQSFAAHDEAESARQGHELAARLKSQGADRLIEAALQKGL